MRTPRILLIILIFFLLVGCIPSGTDITATISPTLTPASLPTITPEPTSLNILSTASPSADTTQSVFLKQVRFYDPFHGLAIGGIDGKSMLLNSIDGGKTWNDFTPAALKAKMDEALMDLTAVFMGTSRIWMAYSSRFGELTPENRIIYSTDAGITWLESAPIDNAGLVESFFISHLVFVDESHGWLMAHVGAGMNHDYITIYRTLDGGSTWMRIVDPLDNGAGIQSCQKNGIWFVDEVHGWLTGSCNGVATGVLLYRSDDGGVTWQTVELPVPAGCEALFSMEKGYCGSNPIHEVDVSHLRVEVACRQVQPVDATVFFDAVSEDGGWTWSVTKVDHSRQYTYDIGGRLIVDLSQEWRWSEDGGLTWAASVMDPAWEGYGIDFQAISPYHWMALVWDDGKTNLAFSGDQGKSWNMLDPLLISE
jgi:photosystem II stability/assembly factor-like uncharacterized protein